MIESVTDYPISQIFDIEARIIYTIPRYQREYTWNKTHWESLFDDIFENNSGYFLGSIICINQSGDSHSIQDLEVVDGQQRLTTLSLLFASVYNALQEYKTDLDDDQRAELSNLKHKLVLKRGDGKIRLIPQIQNNNLDDYKAILAEAKIIDHYEAPGYAGNRKIFRAYRYFQNRINNIMDEQKFRLESIIELLDKISHAVLVKIEVGNYSDAYTLFESLNDRGMPLTAIDLIKNKLLARLAKSESSKIDKYFSDWNRLLGYLGDDYATQERFFRHYYNAFKGELKAISQVSVASRSNLMKIYENLINDDAKNFLQSIINAGELYSQLIPKNEDSKFDDDKKFIKNLDRIQGAPSYLLLLYLLVKKDKLELTNTDFNSVVELLVRFFTRRNLTDTPPTRDITRLFMRVIENISNLRAGAVYQSIKQQLTDISAKDNLFKERLEGLIYEENAGVTRFILCALAEQGMTAETWVDLWQFKGKNFLWTIEHIFPQGENIPEDWVSMMANGEKERAEEIQQTHVHKLGNLTISGYNSNLGNKNFVDKRDRKDIEGRCIGYKNNLNLNEDLANATSWSVDQIDKRTEKLVQKAIDLFKL